LLATDLELGARYAHGLQPAAAQPPTQRIVVLNPPEGAREVKAAKRAAFWGVVLPAGAGALFSTIIEPGGKTDVPTWQIATLGDLFGFSATWGVSMGYYQSGQAGYATLSGLTRTALLGGAVLADRTMNLEGAPLLTILALGGVVVWDVLDYGRLDDTIRERAEKKSMSAAAPMLAVDASGVVLGVAGQF